MSPLKVRLNNSLVHSQPFNAEVFGLVSLPLSSGKIEYNGSSLEVNVEKASEVAFHFISLSPNTVCKVEDISGIEWWVVLLICLGCAVLILCICAICRYCRDRREREANGDGQSNTDIIAERPAE